MKEQLINFDTAKLAKKKKFDVPCLHYYKDGKLCESYAENGSSTDVDFRVDLEDLLENYNYKHYIGRAYSAPTQSLLQHWLREKHNLHIYISTTPKFDSMQGGKYKAEIATPFEPFRWHTGKYYIADTYEEVLEQALQQALNLI